MFAIQQSEELQEIQVNLTPEQLLEEPLVLSTNKLDNSLQEAYDNARKEKYRQYYLNKKAKKEAKKLAQENPEQVISEPVISEKKKKSNFTTEEEELLNEIALLQEPLGLAEKTKTTHMVGYKMLIKCVSCNKEALFHLLLNEPELTIQMIDSAKKLDGEDYSNQSRNKILQSIRPLFDLFSVSYTEEHLKKYRHKMEEYNFNYLTANIQKKLLPTYDEYLFRMSEFYSDRSLEYLLINLYREVPVRDDFQLKLVNTKAQTKSKQHNYLLINKKSCQVILNNYKTAKHYGQKTYDLSTKLRELLIAYFYSLEIKEEYVFGNRQLSPVICEVNKKLGYEGGISFLRKMAVTDLYKKEGVTHEQKQELAERMGHSVNEALLIYSGKLEDETKE